MSSDLEQLRDHAHSMATAAHAMTCMVRETPWTKPVPTCGTPRCSTEADQALWRQIADELDAYLAPDNVQESLL